MKRIFTLCFLAILIVGESHAQISSYSFAASSGSYIALSNATAVSPAATLPFYYFASNGDEGAYNNLPIGFSFYYGGSSYTTVSASTNGFATLGSILATSDGFSPGADYSPNDLRGGTGVPSSGDLAPLWDDLDMSSGTFSYQTSGTAGNYVFTMEWKNAIWVYSISGGTIAINFQVKLYQATGAVQYIYQRVNGTSTSGSPSASIGIGYTNSSLATGILSLNNSGTSPAVSSTETTTIATKPANGQTYTFTPTAPVITSFTPTSGCANTTTVTITGLNLSGATSVKIGGTAATITSTSANQITATVGSGTTGTIAVTTPAGTITSTASFTINPSPVLTSVTPFPATICSGNISAITAVSPAIANTGALGSGTSVTNSSSTSSSLGPNPFEDWYGGTKQQMLITASELTAMGLGSGSQISALQIQLAAANTSYALQNYTVRVQNTSLTALNSGTFTTSGFTTVYGPSSYTPSGTGYNSIPFATSFTWNGTSSLLIETSYSNNNTGSSGTTSAYYGSTSFVSTVFYRADNNSYTSIQNQTAASYTYSARNNVKLTFTAPATITWTPVSGLFTNAAATTAYTSGTNASTVYAKLTNTTSANVNTVYTATAASSASSCTASANATVTVRPLPTATLSGTQTICAGSPANLNIAFTGTAPWSVSYTDGATTYTINNINSNPFTKAVSPNATTTYSLTALSVGDGNCSGGGTSGSATITVNPVSVGGIVSSSASVCSGSNSGTLTLAGNTGNVVQWESSVNSGINWTVVSNTTSSLLYTNLTQTTQYRALVKSGVCSSAYSSVATIMVSPVSVGGFVSTNATVCSGTNSGILTLSGYTGSISRWESSVNGISWIILSNTTASQSYTNLTQTTQYRALVQSGACSSAYSSIATITVNPVSVGGSVSSNATVCSGTNSGTLTLTGNTGSVVQWEFSINSGTNWTTLSNTTASQSYANLTQTTQYRVLVKSGACSSAYSSIAIITVSPVPEGGTVSSNASVCSGANSGTLTLSGYTGSINRWESSTNGGSSWINLSNVTASQSYANLTQTTQYRALVQSGACSSIYSSIATITVSPASVGGSVSGSASLCSGASGSLSLSGYTGNIVQWEKSADGGTSWAVVVNTTAGLNYSNLTQTTQYRALIKSGACSSSYSSVATITIKTIPTAMISPISDDACAGQSVAVNITGTAGASVGYSINPGTSGTITLPAPAFNSPTNTGNYTYTITSLSLNGCPGTIGNNTATIAIHALPDAAISGYDYVQIGNQINLTGGTSGGNWSSGNTAVATIGSSSGVVTGGASGTTNITYHVSNTYGNTTCSSSATKAVMITADYVTRNNGNFSNINTWKRGTVNGFVNATVIPASVNTIEVQHDLTLDQDFQVGSNKSFVMSAAGTMMIQPGKVFSAAGVVDFGHKHVTVKSDINGTGAIGQMTNTIADADNVTVERYTDAGNTTTGRRAWRLVTSPITNKTVHEAWQENSTWTDPSSPVQAGTYGTLITGEGLTAQQAQSAGFDHIGGGNHTSIKQYTAAADAGNWGVLPGNSTTGTNIPVSSQPAWMLFVRGDRTVNTTDGKGIATLRATGTLNQAAKTIAVDHTKSYTLAGNPYAAPINFDNIYNSSISNTFIIWNSQQGTYGAYNFITKESNGSYTVVPFNSTAGSTDNNAKYIRSGSGFFVAPASASTDGSITINEQAKNTVASGGINTFRETTANVKKLWVNLNQKNSDSSSVVADGVLARFDDAYSADIDADDALKQWNFNENLDISHNSRHLMIDARPDVTKNDTIQLKLWNVSKRNYELQVKADNFASSTNLQAWLEDSYLGTRQPLSLSGDMTTIGFTVNSDSGSSKNDRFRIVFRNETIIALPVTLTNLKATPKEAGVSISWTTANEVNMKSYTAEASRDGGGTYTVIATANAKNSAGTASTSYDAFDSHATAGTNLYRIRIEAQNGMVTYSNVVSVILSISNNAVDIAVYPNPVQEGKVHLRLSNLAAGTYLAGVYSEGGQLVYQKKIVVGAANTTQSEDLILGKSLAQGSYRLHVTDSNGKQIKDIKLLTGK